jgi:hypothetical protein
VAVRGHVRKTNLRFMLIIFIANNDTGNMWSKMWVKETKITLHIANQL